MQYADTNMEPTVCIVKISGTNFIFLKFTVWRSTRHLAHSWTHVSAGFAHDHAPQTRGASPARDNTAVGYAG